MGVNLEKCPFCGGQPHLSVSRQFIDGNELAVNSVVECGDCGARGPRKDIIHETISIWNALSGRKQN